MLRLGNPCQCQRSTQALKRASQAAAVCGESRTHGDNGGDGETDRRIPSSVPTHWLCVLSLPTHSVSGASKYYYAPVYQGILVGRRKGNEDNGPDRRRPYAM